jgi:hypothetical protein
LSFNGEPTQLKFLRGTAWFGPRHRCQACFLREKSQESLETSTLPLAMSDMDMRAGATRVA